MDSATKVFLRQLFLLLGISEKEKYLNTFLTTCLRNAVYIVEQTLEGEREKDFREKVSCSTSPEQIDEILKQYATPKDYAFAFFKGSALATQEILMQFLPGLSQEQKEKLLKFLPNSDTFQALAPTHVLLSLRRKS